uniref:Uncharacterized protein n=1 Tax=Oryza meridionalis TaxID=40149 RepID=A0A0E0CGD7_9ORYZ
MADGRGGVGGHPPPPPPSSSSVAAAVVARRCGCGLGRLVRRLRRQAALCAARPAPPSASSRLRGGRCQYDPLSYARNFDRGDVDVAGGVDDDSDAAQLYYSYTFSSRFVLPAAAAAARAPSSLAAGRSAPATATH